MRGSIAAVPQPPSGSPLPNPPIFVIGHARSGTTWLYDILTTHPEVAGVFESWMFTRTNGFSPLLRAHWGEGHLARKVDVIGRRPGLGQMITREEAFETVRRLSLDWLSRVLEPGHRFVVEKGPGEYDLMTELFPEARYVHILRDGRDVAVSMHAASRTWAPEMLPHIGRSLTGSARLWSDEVAALRDLAATVGDRFYEIRYEDLLSEPSRVARGVFEFCGIGVTDEQLERILAETSFETRKQADTSGFVREGRAGGWREHFSRLDGLRFHRGAGWALEVTGYAQSRWWWLTRR